MSKECPGKYHGPAVKYIADNEKYCIICQQEIALKKAKWKERAKLVGGVVGTFAIVLGAILRKFTGGQTPSSVVGENIAENAGVGSTPTA